MRDFVSPITTHVYVAELERRVEALESRATSLERLVAAIENASAVIATGKPRNEYMRDYMAERRKKARERVA